jgi:hypothetical protein
MKLMLSIFILGCGNTVIHHNDTICSNGTCCYQTSKYTEFCMTDEEETNGIYVMRAKLILGH